MEADFLETGALDRPGPIGRVVRGALGAVLAAGFYNIATGYRYGGVAEATDVTVWLGLAFALYYFPHIVNLGFRRRRDQDVEQTDVSVYWPLSERFAIVGR